MITTEKDKLRRKKKHCMSDARNPPYCLFSVRNWTLVDHRHPNHRFSARQKTRVGAGFIYLFRTAAVHSGSQLNNFFL